MIRPESVPKPLRGIEALQEFSPDYPLVPVKFGVSLISSRVRVHRAVKQSRSGWAISFLEENGIGKKQGGVIDFQENCGRALVLTFRTHHQDCGIPRTDESLPTTCPRER